MTFGNASLFDGYALHGTRSSSFFSTISIASVIAVLGIGMFALPAGILGSGFVEELGRNRDTNSCPQCGHHQVEVSTSPSVDD